jgi:radical SAM protein with 4Fe4S-binding SPASM domain
VNPREAVIAVTYRCNARCKMCGIWRSETTDELAPKEYLKLPRSLRSINITGGEPFLRKDLVDVVRAIHQILPHARFVFSTNGFRTDDILAKVGEIASFHGKVGVGVSIDGLEATHDAMRGVQGMFRSAVSTVDGLKKLGLKDLRMAMTLTEDNIAEVRQAYDMAEAMGIEFSTTYAHNSEIYFKKEDNVCPELKGSRSRELRLVRQSHLRSASAKDWLRAYHIEGILDPSLRSQFTSHCEAGSRYFFMAPNGDVYPCQVMNLKIGNIRDVDRWDELFVGQSEENVKAAVKRCREDCWMVCNTRSLIMTHPFKAGAWVLRKKVRAHLSPKDN